MKRLRDFQRTASQTTEFLWAQQLTVLRSAVVKRKPAAKKPSVHVPEHIPVPPDILQTLSLGPKYAIEPKTSAPQLLALVRHVSCHVPEEEQQRCISEGVDAIARNKPARAQIPIRRVEAFLSDHSLTLVPADKEGGFTVLSLDLFRKKGHEASLSLEGEEIVRGLAAARKKRTTKSAL
ncbi:hypothetical protein HPB52_019094 [Rhipicephalus sanguineus]|uniref:Uncharacterized protein n=1 Tax=Rhipicephalus sanguineus TaxID=34632 RepID=A0A9D4SXF6_RHISA|nr:hypothetical protein HPB52_019094 [Rhipicephalus sanguineus]